ncbi:MAG: NAD(P)/FAD-dependent oxidoreductase [Dehalococcoidia bacterium]
MTTYDTIVAGAGPAGSTAARLLAQRGARVLILDKAAFPRDKPCGGGVTVRAARELGIDLTPVIEREITGVRVSLRMGKPFERRSDAPLTYMTQRCRLDQYLLERAAEAGADVHDGVAVHEAELTERGVVVRANGDSYQARTLVGADGANGIVARALGLTLSGEPAIALEANVPCEGSSRWEHTIAVDLGGTPGGYGWLFPKGDHLNVGVGGSKWIGPSLRERLSELCAYLDVDETKMFGVRGHYLPLRKAGAPLVRGPALLAGDAAGLVDPLSGEGIDAAFASGRLAAESIGAYLAGDAMDLASYESAVERELMADIEISKKLQAIFQRMPRPCVFVMRRSDRFWRVLQGFVRGEATYSGLRRSLGPLAFMLDGAAALAATRPGGR